MISRFTRGYKFKYKVPSEFCKLVLINDFDKYVVDIYEDGYLVCNDTTEWKPGRYNFQLLGEEGVLEQGILIVLQNFSLADISSYKSKWQTILDAIDASLAGRATQTQKDISVGDKRIGYCDIDELLKLRDFVLGKIAEEKEEEGEDMFNKNDQHVIKFVWR